MEVEDTLHIALDGIRRRVDQIRPDGGHHTGKRQRGEHDGGDGQGCRLPLCLASGSDRFLRLRAGCLICQCHKIIPPGHPLRVALLYTTPSSPTHVVTGSLHGRANRESRATPGGWPGGGTWGEK